jgi:thiol-disulfide isomerase/thioredoxin
LDSAVTLATVAARTIGDVRESAAADSSTKLAAARAPLIAYVRSCESTAAGKAQGADLGWLAQLQMLAGDYDAATVTLRQYIKDTTIPIAERSLTVTATQQLAPGLFTPNLLTMSKAFFGLADTLGFEPGRTESRFVAAQLLHNTPATVDQAYAILGELVSIAKADADTARLANNAQSAALAMMVLRGWERQDGERPDADSIRTMVTNTFGQQTMYSVVNNHEALIGHRPMPIKAARWINTTPGTRTFGDGRVHLLEFTAHWCSPCVASYPTLEAWASKYRSRGLDILLVTQTFGSFNDVSLGPDAELDSLKGYLRGHAVTLPVAVAGPFSDASPDVVRNNNFYFYGAGGLPTVVLVDQKGVVQDSWQGWDPSSSPQTIEQEIIRLLNGGTKASPADTPSAETTEPPSAGGVSLEFKM